MAVQRRQRKTTVYHVKKGAHTAAVNVMSAFGIFALIFLVTFFFILFQWKNVAVRNTLENLGKLEKEVRLLSARRLELETRRNELLKKIPEIAAERFHMVPVQKPKVLKVNREKIEYYGSQN